MMKSRKDGRVVAGYVHLIQRGDIEGILASDIKVGDILVWNYGITAIVVGIRPCGKQSLILSEKYEDNDKVFERTVRKSRVIAVRDNP